MLEQGHASPETEESVVKAVLWSKKGEMRGAEKG